MSSEIWVLPFHGQGHLFPLIELCKSLASRNFKVTLLISHDLSSSIPSSLLQHPLIYILQIPSSPPLPSDPLPHPHHHHQLDQDLEKLLSGEPGKSDPVRPDCVIFDIMMGWSAKIFKKFQVPTVAFFTSGACSAAIEYAMWKGRPIDLKPGEIRLLPGLPEEMALTYYDLQAQQRGPPLPPSDSGLPPIPFGGGPLPSSGSLPPPRFGGAKAGPGGVPPRPGDQPPWLEEVKGTIALMINTCQRLEHPFIEYIGEQIGKPVWGVGPLLPEEYWKSAGSILHDGDMRAKTRRSSVTEDEVIQWLDSKPHGSVLYISFGSEVSPSADEFQQLADALETSTRPFIWVIQSGSGRPAPPTGGRPDWEREEGYYPHRLESRAGERGLIICGWAPQLLILSHPSTRGFLSHCGWNSTVEAIGRGVPFLVWPIRGDQYHDAKLVVKHLKVGYMVSDESWEGVRKEEIAKGIDRLMSDDEMKKRAESLGVKSKQEFPKSSAAALDAFKEYIERGEQVVL